MTGRLVGAAAVRRSCLGTLMAALPCDGPTAARSVLISAPACSAVSGFHLSAAMMKGRIAIPGKDPKTWPSRGRKKRIQLALASAIVTPGPMKKRSPSQRWDADSEQQQVVTPDRASDAGPTETKRSAIVEPKRKQLLDYDPKAHRRAGDKADELFREIVRRAAHKE
jgi:hypothetical protein